MVAVAGDEGEYSEKYENIRICQRILIGSRIGDRKWNQRAISGIEIMFPGCKVDAAVARKF